MIGEGKVVAFRSKYHVWDANITCRGQKSIYDIFFTKFKVSKLFWVIITSTCARIKRCPFDCASILLPTHTTRRAIRWTIIDILSICQQICHSHKKLTLKIVRTTDHFGIIYDIRSDYFNWRVLSVGWYDQEHSIWILAQLVGG